MRPLSVVLFGGTGFIGSHLAARLSERNVGILPGTPLITRDNPDSMKVDNVVTPSNQVLTAAALDIKLTALESVAPQYLAPADRLDALRSRARHAHAEHPHPK